MKKCWIYARVANSSNTELDFQCASLKQYAQKHDFQIVGMTTETVAGLSCNREGLDEVMRAIQNKQADTILVHDFSRIGRQSFEVMDWVRLVENFGAEVISTLEGRIDTEQDKIFRHLLSEITKSSRAAVYCRMNPKI